MYQEPRFRKGRSIASPFVCPHRVGRHLATSDEPRHRLDPATRTFVVTVADSRGNVDDAGQFLALLATPLRYCQQSSTSGVVITTLLSHDLIVVQHLCSMCTRNAATISAAPRPPLEAEARLEGQRSN